MAKNSNSWQQAHKQTATRTSHVVRERLAQETGTIHKDWGGRLPVALVFPNTYYIGMSSLGFQTIYQLFNDAPDIVCERAFLPDSDGQFEMPRNRPDLEPLTLESGRPLREFAVVAFSISYELDYFHMVQLLRAAGIPLLARDRTDDDPIVIAGGACIIDNPEPIADFLDIAFVGEGEVQVPQFVDVLRAEHAQGRAAVLTAAARHPGLYVPAFYDVAYHADGLFAAIRPNAGHPDPAAALPVRKARVRNLAEFQTASVILTQQTEFGNSYLLETARGCARGCRFCLASYGFMPQRERTLEDLVAQARYGLQFRDKIGLMGPSVSDYHAIDELVTAIRALGGKVSLASMRADSISPAILSALIGGGARTITFAPEGGSQRMRDVINKNLNEDQILACAELIGRMGGQAIKLYYMCGLPGESEDDVQAIVDLTLQVKDRLNKYAPGGEVQGSVTPHVPKSHTPFQWAPMYPLALIEARVNVLRKALRSKGVVFKIDSPKWLRVQGVLARGDRRLSQVLVTMAGMSHADWKRALDEAGLTEDFYARERPLDEVFPWSHIEEGVTTRALGLQWQRALSDTPGYAKGQILGNAQRHLIEFYKTGDATPLRVAR
ncbi:MAG TPA: radical SAM protein [Chloroflexia bacterium]|nr:radical SAM protein [Chloroflexia bacterium]